jgi:sortase A
MSLIAAGPSRKKAAVGFIVLGQALLALAFGIAAYAWLRPAASAASDGQDIPAVAFAVPATPEAPPNASSAPVSTSRTARGVFIRIPRLGIDEAIHEGVTTHALELGVGHFPATALPGALGNCALAAHGASGARHGAPFEHLDELKARDEVLLHDGSGRTVRYLVTASFVVDEHDLSVLRSARDARLTLITCVVPSRVTHERRVVTAVLSR